MVNEEAVALEIFDIVALAYPLSFKAMVDMTNVNGDAPIHCACRYGKNDLVERLIRYGCDLNVVNTLTGETAQHIASARKDDELTALLLEKDLTTNYTVDPNLTETAKHDFPANPMPLKNVQLQLEERRASEFTTARATARSTARHSSSLIAGDSFTIEPFRRNISRDSVDSTKSFQLPLRLIHPAREKRDNLTE
jgi:hypothetical protein